MTTGLLVLPWWGYLIVALVLTHITIVSVTIFLHRCQAHRALTLHPIASHFFRFWLWLTTGMITKQWVAVHRKHHAKTETAEDPHSPHIKGIHKVLWEGAELYRAEARNAETLKAYGRGTPDDWLERHVYSAHPVLGVTLLAIVDLLLFGIYGITLWAVQMMWIPFFAAGVVNGLGHFWGYRNFESPDGSTNLTNFGILIGGEEMHNNHHAFPTSARFSNKWWEFDIGWMYIRMFSILGLAKVKRVAPRPVILESKDGIDTDTARAVISARLHVMAQYAKRVTLPVFRAQLRFGHVPNRYALRKVRHALVREESRMDTQLKAKLQETLLHHEPLRTVHEYRVKLQALWGRTHESHEQVSQALQDWCRQAEATQFQVLQDFARSLRGFALRS
ncbi:MAG: fatty acid desaturase [Pseudomonadota bacterium]|nr:fatty acid desaturase [Pseudomonadota bacterium]